MGISVSFSMAFSFLFGLYQNLKQDVSGIP